MGLRQPCCPACLLERPSVFAWAVRMLFPAPPASGCPLSSRLPAEGPHTPSAEWLAKGLGGSAGHIPRAPSQQPCPVRCPRAPAAPLVPMAAETAGLAFLPHVCSRQVCSPSLHALPSAGQRVLVCGWWWASSPVAACITVVVGVKLPPCPPGWLCVYSTMFP